MLLSIGKVIVMRYGAFYGPSTTGDQDELVRRRRLPLVCPGGPAVRWLSWRQEGLA